MTSELSNIIYSTNSSKGLSGDIKVCVNPVTYNFCFQRRHKKPLKYVEGGKRCETYVNYYKYLRPYFEEMQSNVTEKIKNYIAEYRNGGVEITATDTLENKYFKRIKWYSSKAKKAVEQDTPATLHESQKVYEYYKRGDYDLVLGDLFIKIDTDLACCMLIDGIDEWYGSTSCEVKYFLNKISGLINQLKDDLGDFKNIKITQVFEMEDEDEDEEAMNLSCAIVNLFRIEIKEHNFKKIYKLTDFFDNHIVVDFEVASEHSVFLSGTQIQIQIPYGLADGLEDVTDYSKKWSMKINPFWRKAERVIIAQTLLKYMTSLGIDLDKVDQIALEDGYPYCLCEEKKEELNWRKGLLWIKYHTKDGEQHIISSRSYEEIFKDIIVPNK